MKAPNLRRLLAWLAIFSGLVLTGCAHPINLNGDASKIMGTGLAKAPAKVGVLITEAQTALEVVGPGGGGDKVSYRPYRDIESNLYVALAEVFSGVTKLQSREDAKIKDMGLKYVVTPELATTSHSPSLLTWPPTVFTVEITCRLTDVQTQATTDVRVQGEGRAEFDEFKSDFSLSAKRAATDALTKLVKALHVAVAKLP